MGREAQAHPPLRAAEASNAAGAVTAKAESGTLLEANRNRISAYIANAGTKTVYLALGSKAEASKGIPLAEGESIRIADYTGEIAVIAAEGEQTVCVTEV